MFKIFLFILTFYSLIPGKGQVIDVPNIGAKSHPTLSIHRIEKMENNISIEFILENKSEVEDNFCVDEGTYLGWGKDKVIMEKITGMTTCPDKTYFKPFEKTKFTLTFLILNKQTYYFDIIEPCTKFCFYFKGVIIDQQLNDQINEAYISYQNDKLEKAENIFKQIIQNYSDYPYGIWYFNLINILEEEGKKSEYKLWVERLERSSIKDKEYYLKLLNESLFN